MSAAREAIERRARELLRTTPRERIDVADLVAFAEAVLSDARPPESLDGMVRRVWDEEWRRVFGARFRGRA